MKNNFKEFIFWLDECQWDYKLNESVGFSLEREIFKRYDRLSEDYVDFLNFFTNCSNSSDTAWFLNKNDFNLLIDGSFKYNVFEKISLESSFTDHDIENIKKYWDRFLPIVFSLHNGYEYYAIDTVNDNIVYGYEPIFEENEIVANSFTEFIKKIIEGKIIV